MTEKQKRFADEYLIDLNAARAYAAAYPGARKAASAANGGSRLMKNRDVRSYIKRRIDERAQRTGVNQDMVIKELARIAFARIDDYVCIEDGEVIVKPTSDIGEEKIGAVAAIKEGTRGIEIKMNDKVRALELLGRHLGLFSDRQDIRAGQSIEQYLEDWDGEYEY